MIVTDQARHPWLWRIWEIILSDLYKITENAIFTHSIFLTYQKFTVTKSNSIARALRKKWNCGE